MQQSRVPCPSNDVAHMIHILVNFYPILYLSVQVFVHVLQLGLKVLLQLLPHEVAALAQETVVRGEEVGMEVHVLHLLVVSQLRLLAQHHNLLQDKRLHLKQNVHIILGKERSIFA